MILNLGEVVRNKLSLDRNSRPQILPKGQNIFFKNINSSTSHKKKTPSLRLSLRESKKILLSTFIYEPILIENCMNANIMKTQIFHKFKYDLKGH